MSPPLGGNGELFGLRKVPLLRAWKGPLLGAWKDPMFGAWKGPMLGAWKGQILGAWKGPMLEDRKGPLLGARSDSKGWQISHVGCGMGTSTSGYCPGSVIIRFINSDCQ